jgi:hypothetical protein
MTRSVLALAAVLGFAISSGVAFGCPAHEEHVGTTKQTIASADGQSKPIVLPTTGKDG